MASNSLRILHFNDVYELDENLPKFIQGLKNYREKKDEKFGQPLTIFSGDVFSPTQVSSQMKGQNMIKPLQACEIDLAVYGNHDFDYGIKQLLNLKRQLQFPWIMSNLKKASNDEPICEAIDELIIEHNGVKIGIMGLIEQDWFTILHVDVNKLDYQDFIEIGKQKVEHFREQKCDLIVAVTHMRNHNDVKLAECVDGIDIVLGGHDHVIFDQTINNTRVIKSGTNFRNFGVIDIDINKDNKEVEIVNNLIDVESLTDECEETKQYVIDIQNRFEKDLVQPLAHLQCELDTRFSTVRLTESNFGNFCADLARIKLNADCVILNGGALRTDCIIKDQYLTEKILNKIFAIKDVMVVKNVKGSDLLKAIENGVSKYPSLDGRFPVTSNINFTFDSDKPPMERVLLESVYIDNRPIELDDYYKVGMKYFQAKGNDGYESLMESEYIIHPEADIYVEKIPIEFFSIYVLIILGSIKVMSPERRQSYMTLQKRKSMNKLDFIDKHGVVTDYFDIDGEERQLYSIKPILDGRVSMISSQSEK